jgi:hypothetical protein
MSTQYFLTISANGTYSMRTGRSAGGGAGWGASSGGGGAIASGKWKTQGKVVMVSEGGPYQPYARYYVEAQKLMFTFSNGNREIWYRSR